MPVIRWSSFLAIVVFAVACSDTTAPPAGYTHAAAMAACGPADGPAVAIYLSPYPVEVQSPPPPFISIYINQAVEQIGGKTWTIGNTSTDAGATLRLSADSVESATAGSVTTSSVSADKTIDGTVDITFPNARFIGVFHAAWISASPSCV